VSKSKNPNDAIETARAIGELVHSTEFKEKTRYFSYQDILNERAELHAAHARRKAAAIKQTASPDLATPSTTDTRDTKRREGLPTPDIAELFDGAPYPKHEWNRRASDRKWLEDARKARGEQGGAPAMWCPLKIGHLVWKKYPENRAKLKRAFQNPRLAPWRDEWEQHVDLFSDDD
jgi:hypothetical protein